MFRWPVPTQVKFGPLRSTAALRRNAPVQEAMYRIGELVEPEGHAEQLHVRIGSSLISERFHGLVIPAAHEDRQLRLLRVTSQS